jgi:prophage regulatory protein
LSDSWSEQFLKDYMNSTHGHAKGNEISHGLMVHDETFTRKSQDGLREHSVLFETCILGEAQVQQLTNLSRTTRWRLERRGEFPKRVRLSPGRVGWRRDEIQEWIYSRSQ